MGLIERQRYRNVFLKSEAWQSIRAESLFRWEAKCFICLKESVHNDVHHIWYPRRLNKTQPEHTRVLCRRCHKLVHKLMKKRPIVLTKNGKKSESLHHYHFWIIANTIMRWLGIQSCADERYDQFALRHNKMSGRTMRKRVFRHLATLDRKQKLQETEVGCESKERGLTTS